MGIFGIGIDIVEVDRITSAIEKHGSSFAERLFTADERAYCEKHTVPARYYAARFAAKEAISKALGTGIGGRVGWLDLEIVHSSGGAPKVLLRGKAAEFARQNGIVDVQISLTHAREYAAANAMAITGDGEKVDWRSAGND